MTKNSIWEKAQTLKLQVSENILPGFDIGFDKRIPKENEKELRSFVSWVESNYCIPITLYVDFEYNLDGIKSEFEQLSPDDRYIAFGFEDCATYKAKKISTYCLYELNI